MIENLHYTTAELAAYYSQHRIGWEGLYPSERVIFDRIAPSADARAIDLGCACGGLGVALRERFGITDYTGVDINEGCIAAAPSICPWGTFHAGDFLEVRPKLGEGYDLATSLSAADWNVCTGDLLRSLFGCLRPGGSLIVSVRLTNDPSVEDCLEVRQSVTFGDRATGEPVEYAPYKVYRLEAILDLLTGLGPVSLLDGYGYWGSVPASVEELPLERIFYLVITVRKAPDDHREPPRLQLDIAADFLMTP